MHDICTSKHNPLEDEHTPLSLHKRPRFKLTVIGHKKINCLSQLTSLLEEVSHTDGQMINSAVYVKVGWLEVFDGLGLSGKWKLRWCRGGGGGLGGHDLANT